MFMALFPFLPWVDSACADCDGFLFDFPFESPQLNFEHPANYADTPKFANKRACEQTRAFE